MIPRYRALCIQAVDSGSGGNRTPVSSGHNHNIYAAYLRCRAERLGPCGTCVLLIGPLSRTGGTESRRPVSSHLHQHRISRPSTAAVHTCGRERRYDRTGTRSLSRSPAVAKNGEGIAFAFTVCSVERWPSAPAAHCERSSNDRSQVRPVVIHLRASTILALVIG